MDGYSGRRAAKGLVASRSGPGHGFRGTANTRDQSAQLCNKTRCNGRLNIKGKQIGYMENANNSKPLSRSSTGKEIIGSSSKTSFLVNKPRKLSSELSKKPCSHVETDSSETSSMQDEPEASELIHAPRKIQKGLQHKLRDHDPKKSVCPRVGGSSIDLNTRSRRNINKRPAVDNQDILTRPTVPVASKNAALATRGATSRYGFGNLKCNSLSDVIASKNSSTESNVSRRKEAVRKNSAGESSSRLKGKRISCPPSDGGNSSSSSSICISDTRQARNSPLREHGPVSARSRRSFSSSMARLSNQGSQNNIRTKESSVRNTQVPQINVSFDMDVETPSHQVSEESFNPSSSYSQTSSGTSRAVVPLNLGGDNTMRSAMNRDSLRHYSVDGIAEVLLELERIDPDEELTYEQMLVLDSYLVLNGLSFYDQHRDMRLDIDNMSYEELLALEERMGTVSTALPEEALSKCLKKSIYQPSSADEEIRSPEDKNDFKCSICQEEYAAGDEMGNLQCEHKYHMACIHQWLQLKNWCPICKASAKPLQQQATSK